jgi:hypothetical protein
VNTIMQDVEDWFARHHHTSAAPAAAAVTIKPNQGGPVSLLDEIKNDAKTLAAKFEAVDTAAMAKMEAIQANPGAMQLVDTALAYLHLPPEAFGAAIGVLGEIGKLYVPQQPAQPEPAPSFTPAGPQVGGQA